MGEDRVRGWAVALSALVLVAAGVTLDGDEDPQAPGPRTAVAVDASVPLDRPRPRTTGTHQPVAAPLPETAPPPVAAAPDPPVQGRRSVPVRADAAAAPAGSPEQRGREALATLDYPWQELGYEIRFAAHRGGHLLGLADGRARVLTVYVRGDQSLQSLRVTIAHEIGHALDHVTGDDASRARYREVRGIAPDTPWYPCGGCSDYASPAGDFAEVFAYAVAGAGDFRSRLGPPPDAAQLRQLAPLFAPPSQRPRSAPAPQTASASPSPRPSQLLPLVP